MKEHHIGVGHYHKFNTYLAQKYGLEEAVMLGYLYWLYDINAAQNKYQREGKTWIKGSYKKIAENIPFWSEKQVARILKSLISAGILEKKTFLTDEGMPDRTGWYTFTEPYLQLLNTD